MRSGQGPADDESPSGVLSTTKAYRLLPIPPQPPFQIEAKCEVFVMKSVFIHIEIATNYHNKNFALGLALCFVQWIELFTI